MSSDRDEKLLAAIRELDMQLSRMAALVETQLTGAISAFERRDLAAARALIDGDRRINQFDRTIEDKVMALLRESPIDERNLREVMSVMRVTNDLERVGDLAKNVAKRTILIAQDQEMTPIAGVARMGRVSARLFSDILDAYAARNTEAARAGWHGDDEVDQLYHSVFTEILEVMAAQPQRVNACAQLVFIAKNFERVADHATNIAEATHFLVTGTPHFASPVEMQEAISEQLTGGAREVAAPNNTIPFVPRTDKGD